MFQRVQVRNATVPHSRRSFAFAKRDRAFSTTRKNTPELGTLESLLWNAVRGTRASALVAQTPKFKRLSFPPGLSLLCDLPRTYDVVPPRLPSDRSLLRSNDARISSILDFPRLTPSHGLFTRFFQHWQIPTLELLIDAINRSRPYKCSLDRRRIVPVAKDKSR